MQRRPKKKKRRDPVREFENTVTRLGEETRFWNDTYVQLLRMKWRYLLFFFILIFLFFNAMFAFAYLSIEGSINKAQPGSFLDAFFFSVQTSTTIGYGGMTPNGVIANVLVTIEALTALLGFAVATGLVFAKFSRPTGRILYSDRALITKRNGVPCFVFRLTNERQNRVVEASLSVTALLTETTQEGETLKRLFDLELARSVTPMFTMSWFAIHEINPESPLYGMDQNDFLEQDVRFIISLTGIDGVFSQTIYSNHLYFADEVVWNARFVDVIQTTESGQTVLDLTKFHDYELVEDDSLVEEH